MIEHRFLNRLIENTEILSVKTYESSTIKAYSVGVAVVPPVIRGLALFNVTGKRNVIHLEISKELYTSRVSIAELTPKTSPASKFNPWLAANFGKEFELEYLKEVYRMALEYLLGRDDR